MKKVEAKDRCDCEEWATGLYKMESDAQILKHHGVTYGGPYFRWCPWCGCKLKEQDNVSGG